MRISDKTSGRRAPARTLLTYTLRTAAAFAASILISAAASGGRYLLENFTSTAARTSENIAASTDRETPHTGLACLAFTYDLAESDKATAWLDCRGRDIGTVIFWLRGDESGNRVRLSWRHSYLDDHSNVRDHREGFNLDVRLDFSGWREFSVASPEKQHENALLRLVMVEIFRDADSKATAGTFMIDEMTVDVPGTQYAGDARITLPGRLSGAHERAAIAVDVRNYARSEAAACSLHARLLDGQGNRIGEMRRQWQAPAGSSTEQLFAFDSRLEDYIPPLEVVCEFVSAGLNADFSETRRLAMPVARSVLASFGQVQDLWRGGEARVDQYNEQRESTVILPDTISGPDARIADAAGHVAGTMVRRVEPGREFGRFALEWGYTLGGGQDAIFYAQFMDGAPISMSVWVNGDGSGNRLFAGVRDWGRRIGFGGNRSRFYEHPVCVLDFTGWRRFEFDLPAAGLGGHDPQGSHETIDYPLELVGFYVRHGGGECPSTGTLQVGTISLANQVEHSKAIDVEIACGIDDGIYRSGDSAAVITARNTHLLRSRKVRLNWSLRNAEGVDIATGAGGPVFELPPDSFREVGIAFPEVSADAAPFTLVATVRDVDDPAAVASDERIFSLPNAVCTWTFDARREFYTSFHHLFPIDGSLAAAVPSRVEGPIVQGGRTAAPLNWAAMEGAPNGVRQGDASSPPVGVSALLIEPALPGMPVSVSADIFGDGSGVVVYPIFTGEGTGEEPSASFTRNIMIGDPLRIDFTGWRRLTFRAPAVNKYHADHGVFRRHMPIYPLNLVIAAAADAATKGTAGRLLVDDLRVETQLPPAERLGLRIRFTDASDFLQPETPLAVEVQNRDLLSTRTVKLRAAALSPAGAAVAQLDTTVALKPGEIKTVSLTPAELPRGAWWFECSATDDRGGSASIRRPLVVANWSDFGEDMTWPDSFRARHIEPWPELLIDDFSMRKPVGETHDTVRLDWDLLEPHPQLFEFDRLLWRLASIRKRGDSAGVMLGFSAFWAAGEGYEQAQRGAYNRPRRHIGYTTDYWHVPERIEDWDNFIHHITRETGGMVDVWSFWDNPDVPGLIELHPRKAAAMLSSVRRWTARYSPGSRIMLTGLNVGTAVDYLNKLAAEGAHDCFDIVNIKINPGVHPPEVWRFAEYISGLKAAAPGKDVLVTEMDWPVMPLDDESGFNALGQGQNLARTCLLAHWMGISQPVMRLANVDYYPTGTGLTYRLSVGLSGSGLKSDYLVPRPAYLAVRTVRSFLGDLSGRSTDARAYHLKPYASVEMDDLLPGNTHAYVYEGPDGAAAALWRVEGSAGIELPAGAPAAVAHNAYGSPVAVEGRVLPICETPLLVKFRGSAADVRLALLSARLLLPESEASEKAMVLTDRVVPAFGPSAKAHAWTAAGDTTPVTAEGIIPGRGLVRVDGIAGITSETFELACPAESDMILRRRYSLAGDGGIIEVVVNGSAVGAGLAPPTEGRASPAPTSAGKWNLAATRKNLQGGIRDAFFVVPRRLLAAQGRQKIELRHTGATGTTYAVWAMSAKSVNVPLGQIGPIYAAQAVGEMHLHRNAVGDALKIGTDEFPRGIGTHAWSLIEYPLNGQFAEFRVKVGVDACSDGRGSVRFEIIGDGETLPLLGRDNELAKSSVTVTGLTDPAEYAVSVKCIDRLTLVVHEDENGNKGDAANWLNPVLTLPAD